MAARALHADHVPVIDDLDFSPRETPPSMACRRFGLSLPAGAPPMPTPIQSAPLQPLAKCHCPLTGPAARAGDGGLHRVKTAGEYLIRAVSIDFTPGFQRARAAR